MNQWLKKILAALLVLVFMAGMVRLAWELLRPAVPTLIALLVAVAILTLILRKTEAVVRLKGPGATARCCGIHKLS